MAGDKIVISNYIKKSEFKYIWHLRLMGRLKTEGNYKITLVQPTVPLSEIISETALKIFPKRGMKLGPNKGSNVTEPLFS